MLDPKHLLWLAEVSDLGSMSRAAQKLNVTQPTLTRAIQVIEDHVGAKVLEREARGVRPTAIGERMVDMGRKILASKIEAEDIVDLWKEGLDRDLRIGVGPMLATSVMGGFFADLVNNPPGYAIRVVSATASRLIERLNDGELDVVLAPAQINLFQDDLVQEKLFADELAIFAGARHPVFTQPGPVAPTVLAQYKWISVGTLSGIYGSNKEVLSQLGIDHVPPTMSFTGDINMVLEILAKTDSLCVLPRRLSALSASMRHTQAVDVAGTFPTRDITFWSQRKDRDRPDILSMKAKLARYLSQFDENTA